MLFSSHVLAEVEQICTHAVVMDKGKLVAAGSVDELIGASGSVYLEVDDVADRAAGARGAARRCSGSTTSRPGSRSPIDGGPPVGARRSRWCRPASAVETVTARRRLEEAFLGLVEAF